jgi:CHAD domain-containing protein
MEILLPLREANLLRKRIRAILALRDPFFKGRDRETVHDLRVTSRRLRELLDYLSASLPEDWLNRTQRQAAKITKELGDLRETEVNFRILREWHREKKNHAAAIELMIQNHREIMSARKREARERISHKKLDRFEKILHQVKGSRKLTSLPSQNLNNRTAEFLSFDWARSVDDASLHELRIQAKKLRYTLEIYNTLQSSKNFVFPLESIRELQEVLGQIHDLCVLETAVGEEQKQWSPIQFEMIPSALAKLRDEIRLEKQRLYSSVLPLYSRAVESLHIHFRAISA